MNRPCSWLFWSRFLLPAGFLILGACSGSDSGSNPVPISGAIYRADAGAQCSGTRAVRFVVTDARKIERFDSLLGQYWNLIGTVATGDGGVNPPSGWHLKTDTADLVLTSVACNLCPAEVDAELTSYVDGTKSFCMPVQLTSRQQ
jgi:hypothetical protein